MPKRFPIVIQAVLGLLAVTLLATSCMGGHDPNFRLGGEDEPADAAPTDLEVIDATPEPITCTGSECTCPTGSACDFICPGGSCEIECQAESRCDIDCAGGSCLITCGEGSQCSNLCMAGCQLTCNGGDCSQNCPGGAHLGCTCTGCD